jgi:glycosyltransferase involved in cell wall biosynthesis
MDLLFLTESLPYPLINRSRLRNYYLLRYLVQQHQVTLASFAGEATRPAHIKHLAEFIPTVHTVPNPTTGRRWWRNLFSRRPAGLAHAQGAAMEALLARLVAEQRARLVFAGGAHMGRYALAAYNAARLETAPRLVWDIHRAPFQPAEQAAELSGGLEQLLWRREADRYRRYLITLLPRCAHTLVLTTAEKGSLLHLFPPEQGAELAGRVHVLPVGIDEIDTDMISNEEAGPQILFLASENSPAVRRGLAWFLDQVFPAVRAQVPEAYLTLLARRAEWFSAELEQGGSLAGPAGEAVTIHDYISNLNPFWARSRVFVLPLLAEDGLQTGILQAWLRGVPVVSTRAGLSGLSVRPGQTSLVADDPDAFANAVVELLTRPETAQGLARNARHWAARHYDYHTLYADLDPLLAI